MDDFYHREIDFDSWSELAREDPEGFEEARDRCIYEAINAAPNKYRKRLIGLQWRVDQLRALSSDPQAAWVMISTMMWDLIFRDDGLIDNLDRLTAPVSSTTRVRDTAQLLPFRKPCPPCATDD